MFAWLWFHCRRLWSMVKNRDERTEAQIVSELFVQIDPRQLNALLGMIDVKLDSLRLVSNRIDRKVNQLMALVKVEQADLDALDEGLDAATAALSEKIQALVDAGSVPDGDVSALQADLATLQGLSAPAPAEPPA